MLGRRATFALSVSVLAAPALAQAPAFPTRPVRIVVPYPPGGPNDLVARALARGMSPQWRQPVVVDNRPGGAAGVVGTEQVARSEPDGHTLLLNGITHAIAPSLYPNLPFNTETDFTAVSLVGQAPLLAVVNPSIPVTTIAEFIDYARARPGGLAYASTGIGTSIHLSAEIFKQRAGVDILHVPYRGSAPAMTALLAGEVQFMIEAVPSALQHVQSGKLRALAVTSPQRLASLPDLPTVAESGLPGFEAGIWWGVLGPARIPAPIVAALNAAVNASLQDAAVRQAFQALGIQTVGTTAAAFDGVIRTDMQRFQEVVRRVGIRVDG